MYFSQFIINYPIQAYIFFLILWIILEIYYIYSTNLALKNTKAELAVLREENDKRIKEFYSLLKS